MSACVLLLKNGITINSIVLLTPISLICKHFLHKKKIRNLHSVSFDNLLRYNKDFPVFGRQAVNHTAFRNVLTGGYLFQTVFLGVNVVVLAVDNFDNGSFLSLPGIFLIFFKIVLKIVLVPCVGNRYYSGRYPDYAGKKDKTTV